MKSFKKSPTEHNKQQFSQWNNCITAAKVDSLEKLYTKVHEEIRKNPEKVKKERKQEKVTYQDKRRTIVVLAKKDKNGKPVVYKRDRRLTYDERKQNVQNKIKKALKGK